MIKLFVGLTGGFGSGKSTVLAMFRKLGAKTINCDEIVRKLWQPTSPIYGKLEKLLEKEGLVSRNGKISPILAVSKTFENRAFRQRLENIVHPEVFRKIRLAQKRQTGILVAEVPLLFETGFNRKTDLVITVKASSANSITRLTKNRGLSSKGWKARANAQWTLNKKIAHSDIVIENNGNLTATQRQVKAVWENLNRIVKNRKN